MMAPTIAALPARLARALIRGYQLFLSPLAPASCRFYPTCSEYAMEAVETHGVARGLFLAVGRILRCNPWNRGGVDPVPQATCSHSHKHSHLPQTNGS